MKSLGLILIIIIAKVFGNNPGETGLSLLSPITGLTGSLLGPGNRNVPPQIYQHNRIPPPSNVRAQSRAETVIQLNPQPEQIITPIEITNRIPPPSDVRAQSRAQTVIQLNPQQEETLTPIEITGVISTETEIEPEIVGNALAEAQVTATIEPALPSSEPSKSLFSFRKKPNENKSSKMSAIISGIAAAKSAMDTPVIPVETPPIFTPPTKPDNPEELDSIDVQIRSDVQLIFYRSKYVSTRISIQGITGLLRTPGFSKRKTTVFYFPDRTALIKDSPSKSMIQSYTSLKDSYNFVIVDLSKFAKSETLMSRITQQFGIMLDLLTQNSLDPAKIQFIGFGNGAQFCGLLTHYIPFKVGLIVGLDPDAMIGGDTLQKGFADFTITVHTDSGNRGTTNFNGDLVVIVNGGKRDQPGCQLLSGNLISNLLVEQTLYDDTCSHRRAGEIWANAVLNPTLFGATACKTGLKSCQSTEIAYLGPASRNTGIFYLKTGSKVPFGLGDRGL